MDNKTQIELTLKSLNIEFVKEYKFHPSRRWKFDYAIPDKKLAIEYNGIFSNKSRHLTVTGYSGDMEKINQAQLLGWRVLQYTPLNLNQLYDDLNNYLHPECSHYFNFYDGKYHRCEFCGDKHISEK
jgi:hypothetical protein